MGEIADMYEDYAYQEMAEFEAEQKHREDKAKEMEREYMMGVLKWSTQSQGKIMVTKMTKEHLENSIEFIKRVHHNDEISQKWIELLGYELEKRK